VDDSKPITVWGISAEIEKMIRKEAFLSSSRVKIIEIDEETSERYAAIVKYLRTRGTRLPTNDLWVAASAMQHGLKILTTDRHYVEIPQIIAEYYPSD
jgi:predicted nucleic acid-binding protein